MLIYGGYYVENGKWILNKKPFKIGLITKIWTVIKVIGFTPRAGHSLFSYKDCLIMFSGWDKHKNYGDFNILKNNCWEKFKD